MFITLATVGTVVALFAVVVTSLLHDSDQTR
jgi:hypothetical protein